MARFDLSGGGPAVTPDPGGWVLRAERPNELAVEERYRRQGTAYRRARLLHAAGYRVSAVQYSIDDPPEVVGVYAFDGIRFVKVPKLP